ncbi:SH3 domain-containing protein, partial [Acinetobacter baumannii]|nr:SH3 domain-containing protein [Acinetobacter baumannii]
LKARVTLSSSSQMYLRSAKSTSSAPVTMVPNGATVDVIERDNTWAKVKYGGRTGYCMTKFLTILA